MYATTHFFSNPPSNGKVHQHNSGHKNNNNERIKGKIQLPRNYFPLWLRFGTGFSLNSCLFVLSSSFNILMRTILRIMSSLFFPFFWNSFATSFTTHSHSTLNLAINFVKLIVIMNIEKKTMKNYGNYRFIRVRKTERASETEKRYRNKFQNLFG